ncbi:hypothetical protein TMEN_4304 [Trichophyton mentagrophytes]|nr:hypothetical protein TMEN_4304 [Trichophyton mentagrophytes]
MLKIRNFRLKSGARFPVITERGLWMHYMTIRSASLTAKFEKPSLRVKLQELSLQVKLEGPSLLVKFQEPSLRVKLQRPSLRVKPLVPPRGLMKSHRPHKKSIAALGEESSRQSSHGQPSTASQRQPVRRRREPIPPQEWPNSCIQGYTPLSTLIQLRGDRKG